MTFISCFIAFCVFSNKKSHRGSRFYPPSYPVTPVCQYLPAQSAKSLLVQIKDDFSQSLVAKVPHFNFQSSIFISLVTRINKLPYFELRDGNIDEFWTGCGGLKYTLPKILQTQLKNVGDLLKFSQI